MIGAAASNGNGTINKQNSYAKEKLPDLLIKEHVYLVEMEGKSKIFNYYEQFAVASSKKRIGFIRCKKCHLIYAFSQLDGTGNQIRHTKKCEMTLVSQTAKSLPFVAAPSKVKSEMTDAMVSMCAKDFRPFSTVHGDGFEDVIQKALDLGFENATKGRLKASDILPDRTTIRKRLLSKCDEVRENMLAEISNVVEKGAAISADLGKKNSVSYLDVSIQYLNDDWQMVVRALSTKPFYVSKTAENIRKELISVLTQFNVLLSEVVVVTDQGSNFVSAVNRQQYHSLLCICHVLDSVLKHTFLKKFKIIQDCKRLVQLCKLGGVQKRLPDGYKLKQEVETRWSSKFTMLERILRSLPEIRKIIQRMENCPRPLKDLFSAVEGETHLIEAIVSFLKPFAKIISELQSAKSPTIDKVLPAWQQLKNHCSDSNDNSHSTVVHLKSSALSIMKNREQFITDFHKIATCLNPNTKSLTALAEIAERNRIQEKIRAMCSYAAQMQVKKSRIQPINLDAEANSSDELTRYLTEIFSKEEMSDVLSFWRNIGSNRYPNLARLARQILCIPASSASSERSFSAVYNFVQDRRERLKPDTVKGLLFLHSNLKAQKSAK